MREVGYCEPLLYKHFFQSGVINDLDQKIIPLKKTIMCKVQLIIFIHRNKRIFLCMHFYHGRPLVSDSILHTGTVYGTTNNNNRPTDKLQSCFLAT